MNNVQIATKPIKVSVVRIQEIFEIENEYTPINHSGVIKDYVYSSEKRVIA